MFDTSRVVASDAIVRCEYITLDLCFMPRAAHVLCNLHSILSQDLLHPFHMAYESNVVLQ